MGLQQSGSQRDPEEGQQSLARTIANRNLLELKPKSPQHTATWSSFHTIPGSAGGLHEGMEQQRHLNWGHPFFCLQS